MHHRRFITLVLFVFMSCFMLTTRIQAGVTGGGDDGDPCRFTIGEGGQVQFNLSYSENYEGTRPQIRISGPYTGQFPSSDLLAELKINAGYVTLTSITIIPDSGYVVKALTIGETSLGAVKTAEIPHVDGEVTIIGDSDNLEAAYIANRGSYADFSVTFAKATTPGIHLTDVIGWLLLGLLILLVLWILYFFFIRRDEDDEDDDKKRTKKAFPLNHINQAGRGNESS